MSIDVEALRRDLMNENLAAFFGMGMGVALYDGVEDASPEEVIRIARRNEIDLSKYEVN